MTSFIRTIMSTSVIAVAVSTGAVAIVSAESIVEQPNLGLELIAERHHRTYDYDAGTERDRSVLMGLTPAPTFNAYDANTPTNAEGEGTSEVKTTELDGALNLDGPLQVDAGLSVDILGL